MTEQETRTKFIYPKLLSSGWHADRIFEERVLTPGPISVIGATARRRTKEIRRVDYLLEYSDDLPVAVVEAKKAGDGAAHAIAQAKDYARLLHLQFAYGTDGHEIREFDFLTGLETVIPQFPTPDDLWRRLRPSSPGAPAAERHLLAPTRKDPDRPLRYYQQIAINAAVDVFANGRDRALLCMATGTGKTTVAFQICWKLTQSCWNRRGEEGRRPRILFLADRNILIDKPYDEEFAPFKDARWVIRDGEKKLGREMYFAIYQSLAEDERRDGLFREYPRDFFDLVIVDECHRGSSRNGSSWREILEHFAPAAQLGMTATPLRDESRDTYDYFGKPLFTYSLRDGIADGFLAPYRVKRVVTDVDATGWRPDRGQVDKSGQVIPDEEFQTKDFDRVLVLEERTRAIARHLNDYLHATNRFHKTLVFCVDQAHADRMRIELNNLNADLTAKHADYVVRITSDEEKIGRGHLSNFKERERETPVLVTTSEMLTTGVDIPAVRNIAIVRSVGSMATFKQTIGRGTRLAEADGKLFFTILDYTGWASQKFADPDFDGTPVDSNVEPLEPPPVATPPPAPPEPPGSDDKAALPAKDSWPVEGTDAPWKIVGGADPEPRRRYVVDGDRVFIAVEVDSVLDPSGRRLRVVRYSDYSAEQVRTLWRNAAELRARWSEPKYRDVVLSELEARDVTFDELAKDKGAEGAAADPLDLLCHLAWGQPLLTRRQRAEALKRRHPGFFTKYGAPAREVLATLVEKYAEHGVQELKLPDALDVPPLSALGNRDEIIARFGDATRMRGAVDELNKLLYAA